MAAGFLNAVLLKKKTDSFPLLTIAALRLYVCSYNPQSMISAVKQQVYMYLLYILLIEYMFSANVQAVITTYLTIQNVHLPELN
jgi:hypothetical protein